MISPMTDQLNDAFWCRVDLSDRAGCWPWTGSLNPWGYGRAWCRSERATRFAHRLSYQALVGPVPVGLSLDHLCRNKSCVNPAHLEPVTTRENLLRGRAHAVKRPPSPTCQRGHLYDGVNNRGDRTCSACSKIRHKRRQYRLSQREALRDSA